MIKRLAIIVATIMMALLVLGGVSFAWPQFLEGRPAGYHPGQFRGYYIWRDDSGFNLRTTSNPQEHVFTGSIRTDGDLVDIRMVRQEQGDHTRVDQSRDIIQFRFKTTPQDADGIDFKIRGGGKVHFELFIDGKPVHAHEIHLGRNSQHPRNNNFSLPR